MLEDRDKHQLLTMLKENLSVRIYVTNRQLHEDHRDGHSMTKVTVKLYFAGEELCEDYAEG